MTRPGEFKDYRWPNKQDARTLWYHDHGVHGTVLNAYMGCAAFYITHDERELSLTDPADDTYKDAGTAIPGDPYDVPLVLRDAIFGTDGSLVFDDQGHSSLFGDVILVNGSPWPVMEVERRKYRFRILNGSISRGFDLALSPGDRILSYRCEVPGSGPLAWGRYLLCRPGRTGRGGGCSPPETRRRS